MGNNNVKTSAGGNKNTSTITRSSIFGEAKNKKILLLKILDEGDKSPETISRFLETYKNLVSWTMNMDDLIEKSLSYRGEELAQGVAISVNPVRKIEKNLEKVPKQIRNRIFSNMNHLGLREHITKTTQSVNPINWKVTSHPERITITQEMLTALKNLHVLEEKN